MERTIGYLKIGSERAQNHDLQDIEVNIGLQHRTMADIVADKMPEPHGNVIFQPFRSDKRVQVWFSPAGIETFLDKLIGGLPMGFAARSEKLRQLCAMILRFTEPATYSIQVTQTYFPEAARIWRDVGSPLATEEAALKTIEVMQTATNRSETAIYRVIERRERVISTP